MLAQLATVSLGKNTHHFFRLWREAALGSAPLENLIFGGVEADSYRLVPGFHCLYAGFEKQSYIHSHDVCAAAAPL